MRVDIKGTIVSDDLKEVYDWFGIAATSPADVRNAIGQAIAQNDNELTVVINSGGGSVWAGSEMFYDLKNFKGTVKAEIPSIAASAASFLAMAADHVAISILGQMMVHNASTSARGNYMDMNATSDFLQSTDKAIINAYMVKTKKSESELQALMDKTTWMNAQQAKEMGFVDEILFEDNQGANNANASNDKLGVLLPPEAIDRAREAIAKSKAIPEPINHINTQTKPENKKGNDVMDLQTLQNEHPDLFKQVKNIGYEEGVKAENSRIKSIEDMAPAGNNKLVQAAKYDNPVSAEKLAMQIVMAQKEAGRDFYNGAQEDAETLNQIKGTGAPETDAVTDDEQAVAGLNALWGGKSQ